MKDQYFGDIHDYRKYGLLRAIIKASELRLLVAWMLTPDDKGPDGKLINYLEDHGRWSHYDADLFREIKALLGPNQKRQVSLIESSSLLSETEYFSLPVPDAASDRSQWFDSLAQGAHLCEFVFLDPDNGLEVKSRPYGRKNSSKFLYWREVKILWEYGKSLLIYQHFPRENRLNYIKRQLVVLAHATPGSIVEAFSTSHVVFFMALQPQHKELNEEILRSVQNNWKGQIDDWKLTLAQQNTPAELGRATKR